MGEFNFTNEDLGLIITPKRTVDYMISRLREIEKHKKILEPCVGPGVFIERLVKTFKVNPEQIVAYDINSEYRSVIEQYGVDFEAKDTLLSIDHKDHGQFDYIIGNPPYLNKSSTYIVQKRDDLKKIYGKINAHETYAMFLVNSIWRLKEGGRLCFITSDSFLTLRTHKKLRKFILNNCKINEILLAPEDLFASQDVSTSPVIITLQKCSGEKNAKNRLENEMNLVSRVKSEQDYAKEKKLNNSLQKNYNLLPFSLFYIDIEKEIIQLFEKASSLKEFMAGYIGMHTHNNLKHIAAIKGTQLDETFTRRNQNRNPKRRYKIISKEEFKTKQWKPYLKRGGNEQYFRPIIEALEWSDDAVKTYDIPKRAPFEREGIVISGVSSRLAARYMPPGCYWDSNKAMGFIIKDKRISIKYALGVLNSSLYNYLAKGIINNTSSIQITGLRALPFILPDAQIKQKIEGLVKRIITRKRANLSYDYAQEQKQIDEIIYEFYAQRFHFPDSLKKRLELKYASWTHN